MRRLSSILLVLATAVASVAGTDPELVCTDADDGAVTLAMENEDGEALGGLYGAPTEEPEALVVFMHGYGHTSESWRHHVTRTVADTGSLAVAIDYRGDERIPSEDGLPSSRGWNVTAGAQDAIDVTRALLDACASIETVIAYGISMGGNSSGLAVAAGATRADGTTPLFDVWFDIEGATNVVETYLGARALAPFNAFAAQAQEDIEAEMGGPIEEVGAEPYLERSVLYRSEEVAGSGVTGIVMVHALDDGLVPYNQSREFAERLRGLGIPVELHTVTTRGQGEQGTTATGYALGLAGVDFVTAGHASEASETHVVNRIAFRRLAEVLGGDAVTCVDAVYDGTDDQADHAC